MEVEFDLDKLSNETLDALDNETIQRHIGIDTLVSEILTKYVKEKKSYSV